MTARLWHFSELVFDLNQRASFSRPHCRGEQEPDARNSVAALAEPVFVLVGIQDPTAHTFHQFSDTGPVPRCAVCREYPVGTQCAYTLCPGRDLSCRKPPNVRTAIHEQEDGETCTIQTGAEFTPSDGAA